MRLDYHTVSGLCAGVDLNDSKPVIDLTQVTSIEPYGLIYLGMFIRHHNNAGRFFTLHPPSSDEAMRYLESQNFHERFHIDGSWPFQQVLWQPSTSFNDVIDIENKDSITDDILAMVLSVLERNQNIDIDVSLVAEVAVELVDNFQQHSEEQLGACCLQLYPEWGRLDFAIGDCGVGIRESLTKNPEYRHLSDGSHGEAAVKALEDGVTRRHEGGTGLSTVRDNVIDLNGLMYLSTGNAWVQVGAGINGAIWGLTEYSLPGVQVEVSIPLEVWE